jgi:hypothetical protein
MPTVAKLFTPGDIFQGPADVYLDIAAPPSAIPPVAGTNTIALDANGQPTDTGTAGIHLGLTEGPCQLTGTPKYAEIRADQFAAPLDAAYVSMECSIEFAIKELNLSRISKYFAGITSGKYSSLSAGSTNPAADLLQLGNSSGAQANTHTVMLVAPDRKAAGKFLYVFAYRAIPASAIKLEFERKKEAVYKIKFKCIIDPSRAARDQVMQIVRTV